MTTRISSSVIANNAITSASIANNSISPAQLTTGAPTWTANNNLYVSSNLSVSGTLTVSGNIAFQNTTINNVTINTTDQIVVTNTTPSISNTTGALIVSGGVGVLGNLYSSSTYTNGLTVNSSLTLNNGGVAQVVLQNSDNTNYYAIGNNGATGGTNGNLVFYQGGGGATRMILDTSGNLGLGVTPVAWYTAYGIKTLQVGGSSILGQTIAGSTWLSNNAFLDGTNTSKYIYTGGAQRYAQTTDGQHQWFTAPSGNASSAITFTQAMTLDASSRLLVGLTSSLNAAGAVQIGGFSDTRVVIDATSTQGIYFTKSGADNGTWRVTSGGNYEWYVKGAGSANMMLDSSGNFGLGVTPVTSVYSASRNLFIGQATNLIGRSTINFTSLNTNVYEAPTTSIPTYINSSNAATQYVQYLGQHIWNIAPSGTAGNAITFTQAMTLNTNGALVLQGGNTSASGVGIAFPATQSASSDANTLDDYEEGTWTPNLGGITTVNFSYNSGNYVKVGRVVTLWWDFNVSSYSGGSWNSQLGGLPFVVSGSQAGYSASRTRDSGLFNSSLATGYQLMFFAQINQAYLACQVDNSGTAGFGTANTTAPIGSSGRCTGTITYYATS